jgi:hypothetical protein
MLDRDGIVEVEDEHWKAQDGLIDLIRRELAHLCRETGSALSGATQLRILRVADK